MQQSEHCSGCQRERVIGILSGYSVCTYCPEWRKECLQRWESARVLMGVGTVSQRQRWLESYEASNGKEAAQRLKVVFTEMWRNK